MLRAIRFQVAKDTSPERTKFIADYFAARTGLRLLVAMFHRSPLHGLESIALLILGMSRCVALNSRQTDLALWWTKNEERYLKSYLGELSVNYICYRSGLGNVVRSLRYIPVRRLWQCRRIAKMLAQRYSFVVAARAVETMIFYQYVMALVENKKTFRFYSSTQSHPYFSALNELSRQGRIRLCFLAHSPWVLGALPIYCDLGVFWGPAGAKQFSHCGSRFNELAYYYPESDTCSPPSRSKKIILISLSKNPEWRAVRGLINKLKNTFLHHQLAVRKHPNSLFAIPNDIQPLISTGGLKEELLRSDFMIGGNSTVHLEALLHGLPTFWAPELDGEQSSPLEFFTMIPIQRVQRLWEIGEGDIERVYSADLFRRVREDFFADTSFGDLKAALVEFQTASRGSDRMEIR